ncbi:MAG: 4Fe-4S dicluster domain-containing protein, partial [Rhizobacter sp.]|nr:4Fe-4S dicluster domain-containing protein [Rhizobacter sp.]
FLERMDVLSLAAPGATFLLNSPHEADEVWDNLPRSVQQQIIDKGLRLYVIDASRIARETGLGGLINTVLQTCFFAISGVLPREEAIGRIKQQIEKTYGRKGRQVVAKNFAAVDATLAALQEVAVPDAVTSTFERPPPVPASAPEFVRRFTGPAMAGLGDALPVSALPIDGTFPPGTAAFEKRSIAEEVPVWEPELCIQCGQCSIVCPHSVIRARFYDAARLEAPETPPAGFKSAPVNARGYPDSRFTLQFYVDDCTGCGLCVQVCPTGIDIRNGLQYQCIGCASCIDVCNEVMDKMNYPRGLIRFATQNGLLNRWTRSQTLKRVLRPRVLVYSSVLVLICIGFIVSLALRSPFRVDVVRDRGTLARLVDDGNIENVYRLQVMNATESPQVYRVSVRDGLPGARITSRSEFEVNAAEARWLPVSVQITPDAARQLGPGAHAIHFRVERVAKGDESPAEVQEKSTFVVPR